MGAPGVRVKFRSNGLSTGKRWFPERKWGALAGGRGTEARLAGKTEVHPVTGNDPPSVLAQNSVPLLPLQLHIQPYRPLHCAAVLS